MEWDDADGVSHDKRCPTTETVQVLQILETHSFSWPAQTQLYDYTCNQPHAAMHRVHYAEIRRMRSTLRRGISEKSCTLFRAGEIRDTGHLREMSGSRSA